MAPKPLISPLRVQTNMWRWNSWETRRLCVCLSSPLSQSYRPCDPRFCQEPLLLGSSKQMLRTEVCLLELKYHGSFPPSPQPVKVSRLVSPSSLPRNKEFLAEVESKNILRIRSPVPAALVAQYAQTTFLVWAYSQEGHSWVCTGYLSSDLLLFTSE